ncbi:MAG: hypothetical protein JWL95_2864, partial [Gemmatimonadetes bacterium]|nr:hypothetical protein [Gemmatimonadota bacterium]
MHWLSVTGPVVVLLAAAGASSGCGSRTSTPAAPASETQVTSAQAGPQAGPDEPGATLVEHHRHHHGGVAMFLVMSLDSLGASDDQRAAITKIQQDLAAKLEPVHAAQGNVLSLLADGVAAGAVDKAKVDAAIAKVDLATATSAKPATADALDRLHSILDVPQRRALVQKIQAHWQVWQEANGDGGTRALGLTADQTNRIRAGVQSAPPEATKTFDRTMAESRLESFGTTFEGEA